MAKIGHLIFVQEDILRSPSGLYYFAYVFLIYCTLTMSQKASSFHTNSLADYINLCMPNSCFNVLKTAVNLELCKIGRWLRANKFSFNYSKTSFMLLNSQKNNPTSFKIIISNHSICLEDNLKYLGVFLDINLSWKLHVAYKWRKLNHQVLVEFYPHLNILQCSLY